MNQETKTKTAYEVRREAVYQMLKGYRTAPVDDEQKTIIEKAIGAYRNLAETQENLTQLRRCAIVEQKFLNAQPTGNRKLAATHYINVRTVMKDVEEAVADLMVLVYGVDGIQWIR